MSKVGSEQSRGQVFKSVITNAEFNDLNRLKTNNIPVEAHNAIIFSIPQQNGEDIEGEGSIWLSDSDGYLYNITKPINKANT